MNFPMRMFASLWLIVTTLGPQTLAQRPRNAGAGEEVDGPPTLKSAAAGR